MKNLTAIIKTFKRDAYLKRCVSSLLSQYPDIRLAIADDGYPDGEDLPTEKQDWYNTLTDTGNLILYLPFDSGLCVGRNELVRRVQTEYVLVGDDDFAYDERAKVDRMVKFLDEHPTVDLIGGRIIHEGRLRDYQGFIDLSDPKRIVMTPLVVDKHEYRDCCADGFRWAWCDITFNFFVARTAIIRDVPWDEQIKVGYEHSSFFIDMKKAGRKVAFTPDCTVIHKPDDVPVVAGERKEYLRYRSRRSDRQRFFERFGVDEVIDMQGRVDRSPLPSRPMRYAIKTFMRPKSLERLVLSIAKHDPEADVIVGDDSPTFSADWYRSLWQKAAEAGLKRQPVAHRLKRDVGLAAGRNALADLCDSKYVLMLDDDTVFTDQTRVKDLVAVLDAHPDVGVACGRLTSQGQDLHFEGALKREGRILSVVEDARPEWYDEGGVKWRRVDIGFNFALYRRTALEDCRWDPHFKINGEHGDFFLRLKEQTPWKAAYVPSCAAIHAKDIPSDAYRDHRRRDQFLPRFFTKHGIDEYRVFGRIMKPDGNGGIIRKSHG